MPVDLHVHSNASDGTESPSEVVRRAVSAGLSAVALTDHDTLEGVDEAAQEARRQGIELIPGVELACEWDRGGMHIVVLFLEPGEGPLQDRLGHLRRARHRRNRAVAQRLVGLGIEIEYAEVVDEAGDGSIGRPHFAAVMQRKGYVPDFATAFRDYLGAGAPAYVPRQLLAPDEAIALALGSGAVPVLAHPHTLGLDTSEEYAATYRWLAGFGLVGVECFYGEYDPAARLDLERSVRSFGLLPSGGSDFHGDYKPGLQVGAGRGDLVVPDRVLDDLRDARR